MVESLLELETIYSGRPLVFSNRGEVEMIEGLAKT